MDWSIFFVNPGTLLVAGVVFVLAYNYVVKESWKNLPPGPPAIPLLGSLPFLGFDSDFREPLVKMAKKYGDVFTFYMGMRRVVVLNGYDAIREAFVMNSHAFSGRPDLFFVTDINEGYGKFQDIWRGIKSINVVPSCPSQGQGHLLR